MGAQWDLGSLAALEGEGEDLDRLPERARESRTEVRAQATEAPSKRGCELVAARLNSQDALGFSLIFSVC